MGSLMVAGAVGGLGKGMVDNATYSREQADEEAERKHVAQLERQRQRAQSELADKSFGQQQQLAETQHGRAVELQDRSLQQSLALGNVQDSLQATRQATRDETMHGYNMEIQGLKNKGDLDASGHAGANARDKWTTYREPAGFDESGKAMYDYIAERNGIQYRQIGDKYVEVGLPPGSPEPETFGGDKAMQRRAEKDLMDGTITFDQFKDNFFYIPRKWMDRENPDTGTIREKGETVSSISGELEDVFTQAGTLYPTVNTAMLKTIAKIESDFNPDATNSESSAKGMMQFIDGTAKYLKIDPLNPNEAIPGAALYLHENDTKNGFNGEEAKMIASYHAGPTETAKAIKAGGANWVDELPPKTQKYLLKYYAAKPEFMQGGNLEQPAGGMLADAASTEMGPPGPVDPNSVAGPPTPGVPMQMWQPPPPPPDYGAAGAVGGAMATGAGGAGGAILKGGKGAVGALAEGARATKEAFFGKSE